MSGLSDAALGRLVRVTAEPDLTGTRYRLLGRLGEGGMAAVYAAWDDTLGREVALKVLPPGAAEPAVVERLRREARILAHLEHPGIVAVHDLGTLEDGRVFYAMRRVRGRRLDEQVAGPALDAAAVSERLGIFERLCEAVAFAHDRGVVHRDLKPENVMVGAFGEVLVMDWGVAKLLAGTGEDAAPAAPGPAPPSGGTAHGTVVGTPGYMPPEQARGEVERHDRRADVYALGALLRFLLTGRPPGAGDAAAVPPALAAVAARAMAAEPAARYRSAAELAAEIARYRAGMPVTAHREGPLERLGRQVRRYRVPLALVLAYLALRAAFLLFAGF